MLINFHDQFELQPGFHLNETHFFLDAVSLLTRCTFFFFFLSLGNLKKKKKKTPDLPLIRSASAHVNLHFRQVEEMVSRKASAVMATVSQ